MNTTHRLLIRNAFLRVQCGRLWQQVLEREVAQTTRTIRTSLDLLERVKPTAQIVTDDPPLDSGG